MSRSIKKFIFTLSGVDMDKVNKKYGISIQSNIEEFQSVPPTNTTKLCELNVEKGTPELISFLDEAKRSHLCQVSMIDFNTGMYTNMLIYNCFWCRHSFETQGIGCPVKYISNQATKKYHSEISKDAYTIKENVTTKRIKNIEDDRISIKIGEYYETDGIFCSFNCCQAFIDEHKHLRKYDQSAVLIMKMYNKMMGTKAVIIMPAPHWRLLITYGGTMTIDKFRDSFNKIEYELHGTTKRLPKFLSIGLLFEENLKF